jgi:hypothetical protein
MPGVSFLTSASAIAAWYAELPLFLMARSRFAPELIFRFCSFSVWYLIW